MYGKPSERLNFNTNLKRVERRVKTAFNGSTCADDETPNRFIMRPARKNRKPKTMYAPVKVMSPEEYAKCKKV